MTVASGFTFLYFSIKTLISSAVKGLSLWECEDLKCMKAITVDEVQEAILEMFSRNVS